MAFESIDLSSLVVNRANDRHGELENETAAIAWLFNNREQHMRALARDIVERGEIYEPPLVFPDHKEFVVFDGNRRVTCSKILDNPRRAPTVELQTVFSELRARWQGDFPTSLYCQIENDRDRIDDILFRRHTGAQGGVGQTTWDDRMKENFVFRTGRGAGVNVADEVEKRLAAAGMLPKKKVPRSNLNRLLSGESIRNRVGLTVKAGKLELSPTVKTSYCLRCKGWRKTWPTVALCWATSGMSRGKSPTSTGWRRKGCCQMHPISYLCHSLKVGSSRQSPDRHLLHSLSAELR